MIRFEEITTKNVWDVCMMMSIFPAIATMLSAFFISRYPLNEKRLYEISTELEERRKK